MIFITIVITKCSKTKTVTRRRNPNNDPNHYCNEPEWKIEGELEGSQTIPAPPQEVKEGNMTCFDWVAEVTNNGASGDRVFDELLQKCEACRDKW